MTAMSAMKGASQRHARQAAGDQAGRRRGVRVRLARRSRVIAAVVCTAAVALLSAVMLTGAAAGTPGVTTRESVVSETLNADADEASRRSAISGDGRYVAFESDALNLVPGVIIPESSQVYRRDRETGVTELVSVDPDGEPFFGGAARPSISADGNLVAFEGEPNLLPAGPSGEVHVGDVVFISNEDGGQDVFVARSDFTNPVNLTSNPGTIHADPVLSPDGTRVAFSRVDTPAGGSNVYVMNADGSGLAALTDAEEDESFQQPAWSPDGSRLVLAGSGLVNANDMAEEALFIIDVDTGFTERITNLDMEGTHPQVGDDRDPAWSPDGRRIAFSARRQVSSGAFDLFVLDVGTESEEYLNVRASGLLFAPRQPRWSPTQADRLVFSARFLPPIPIGSVGEGAAADDISPRAIEDGTNDDLFLRTFIDGTVGTIVQRLTLEGGFDPTWRRDGAGVVFTSLRSPDTVADLFEVPVTAADNPDIQPVRLTTNPLGAAGATHDSHVGPTFMTRETDLRVTATLAGFAGRPPPTGEVTFRLCPPTSTTCPQAFGGSLPFGAPVQLAPVDGGGSAAVSISTSDVIPPFRFDQVGEWCVSFTYHGDERYLPVHHEGDEAMCVEVTQQVASPALVMDPSNDFDDGEATVNLELTGPSVTPQGLVRFFLCDPTEIDAAGCTTGGTPVGPPLRMEANGGTSSNARPDFDDSLELTQSGRYCWRAEYAGDLTHQPQIVINNGTACFTYDLANPFDLPPHPVGIIEASPTFEMVGTGVISARIAVTFDERGQATDPQTVSVFLCGPAELAASDRFGCRTGGEMVAEDLVLVGGVTSLDFTPISGVGPHCLRIEYSAPEALLAMSHTNTTSACVRIRPANIDTTVNTQVYVRNMDTGAITLVSVRLDTAPARRGSQMASISPDGGHVAFVSGDPDLVEAGTELYDNPFGDFDGEDTHVYLRDLAAGTTALVSAYVPCEDTDYGCASGRHMQPSVSAGGTSVAFTSSSRALAAVNPVTGDPHDPSFSFANLVYVRDMTAPVSEVVSVTDSGFVPLPDMEIGEGSSQPSIDASGTRIAFTSDVAELVEGDTNDVADVFVRDRTAMTTRRVSVSSLGTEGDLPSFEPAISADGRTVAFASAASTIAPGITNNATCSTGGEFPVEFPCMNADVFVHDLVRGTTARVSVDSDDAETELGADSRRPAISTDGRFVAFDSDSTQLVDGDGNDFRDVFVRDRTPVLVLLPDPAVFADQLVGTDSAPITISAINAGSGPLQISELTITGDAADFSIVPGTDTCTGASLFTGDVCTVDVRFSPTVAGARSAFLNAASTAPGSPVSAVLQGTGTEALAEVTPDPLDFGTVPALGAPETRIATLSSIGTAPVTVTSVAIGGPDAARFFVAAGDDGCTAQSVAPGTGCGVVVSFAPQESRDHTATLTFTDDAAGSPRTITMIGTGAPTLQAFQLTPDPLDFGLVQRGTTTPPGVVTGLSTGDVAVPLGGVDIAGAHPGDFVIVSEDETCAAANVAPGEACQIPIRFTPTEVGPREATLRVMVAGELRTTRLIGAGFDPDPVLTLEPDPADFGVVVATEVGEPLTLTATNVSAATLSIAEVAIVLPPPVDGEDPPELPEFAITEDGDGCTGVILAPGGTCELAVVFAPVVPGQKSAVALVRGSTGALADAELIGLSPEVEPLPALGPPGFVTEIVGRDFPPNELLVIEWDPGLGRVEVTTNAEGTFRTPMLVMRRDRLGLREAVAIGPDGSYRVVAEFLVTPGTAQPADFISRR